MHLRCRVGEEAEVAGESGWVDIGRSFYIREGV